jgi:hypothetical protein
MSPKKPLKRFRVVNVESRTFEAEVLAESHDAAIAKAYADRLEVDWDEVDFSGKDIVVCEELIE